MPKTIYAYYTPGCVEKLRVLDQNCRRDGDTLRLLTIRTGIKSALRRKYVGPAWMFALHAAGGGVYHDFRSSTREKITKTRIEKYLKRHATLYRRAKSSK